MLFNFIPLTTMLSLLTGTVIPYLSALLTKRPNAWTGVVTLALASVSGFLSSWAAANGQAFNWKGAVGTAFVTWIIAVVTHSKILAGTETEAKLHAHGVR